MTMKLDNDNEDWQWQLNGYFLGPIMKLLTGYYFDISGYLTQTYQIFKWPRPYILRKNDLTYMSPVSPIFHIVSTVNS